MARGSCQWPFPTQELHFSSFCKASLIDIRFLAACSKKDLAAFERVGANTVWFVERARTAVLHKLGVVLYLYLKW